MSNEVKDFKEAREYVRILGLKVKYEWEKYCRSGYKPDFIPANPDKVYQKKKWFNLTGWVDWTDWLGADIIDTKKRKFLRFSEAREFVHSLNLKDSNDWKMYCKSGHKPSKIPASPQNYYKKKWNGIGDWLGNGKVRNRKYRSFSEAREFVRTLGIKNRKEWEEYCKSGNKPDDIPANPWVIYHKNKLQNQKEFDLIENYKKIFKKINVGISRE